MGVLYRLHSNFLTLKGFKHLNISLLINSQQSKLADVCVQSDSMSGDHRTVIKGSPSQYVKLNVGGSLHYTTIGTLTKHDTMLRAMFSGRMEVLTDSEGKWHKVGPIQTSQSIGTILIFIDLLFL